MKPLFSFILIFLLSLTSLSTLAAGTQNPSVIIHTSMGNITVELDAAKAPVTVENFLQYAKDGFYDGTIFHRVISDFMVQGGGFDESFSQKSTRATIQNEADNGLGNARGTIAMARTNAPHSATAQFFINLVDNTFLNHTSKSPRGWGYAVFGKVTEGMEVVDNMAKVRTTRKGPHGDVPVNNIVITSVEVVQAELPKTPQTLSVQ